MQNPTPSMPILEDAVHQFNTWRNSKTRRFEPIPSELRLLLLQLLNSGAYSKKQILTSLKLSYPLLSSIQKANNNAESNKQNVDFVPFKIIEVQKPGQENSNTEAAAIRQLSPSSCSNPHATGNRQLLDGGSATIELTKPASGSKLLIHTNNRQIVMSVVSSFLQCSS
jgi:hypothetical protein